VTDAVVIATCTKTEMSIPTSRKQLEWGVTLPDSTSSSRSSVSRYQPGPWGSVNRLAWEGPEPVGFPYLWNLSQYYSERNIEIFTFKGYGDQYVVCLGDFGDAVWSDYRSRLTLVRLWLRAANLEAGWRMLLLFTANGFKGMFLVLKENVWQCQWLSSLV